MSFGDLDAHLILKYEPGMSPNAPDPYTYTPMYRVHPKIPDSYVYHCTGMLPHHMDMSKSSNTYSVEACAPYRDSSAIFSHYYRRGRKCSRRRRRHADIHSRNARSGKVVGGARCDDRKSKLRRNLCMLSFCQ